MLGDCLVVWPKVGFEIKHFDFWQLMCDRKSPTRQTWLPVGDSWMQPSKNSKPRRMQAFACQGCGATKVSRKAERLKNVVCLNCFGKFLQSKKWGKLTVVDMPKQVRDSAGRTRSAVICRCDCGTFDRYRTNNLMTHNSTCCKSCRSNNRLRALRHNKENELEGALFGDLQFLRNAPDGECVPRPSRPDEKRHTGEFLCLGCHDTVYKAMEEAVANASNQACSRCYDVKFARLKLGLATTQIQQGRALFAEWDYITFGDAIKLNKVDAWEDAIDQLRPLVRDTASTQAKIDMNAGHYAAFRNYRDRPDVKTAACLRSVLLRVLKAGGKDKSYYHGQLDCQKICFCSYENLVAHVEAQFESWMNWNNQGKAGDVWHLDHIYPVSRAIREKTEQYVNHWKNLRPLAGPVNHSKSNKITPEISAHWQSILNEVRN